MSQPITQPEPPEAIAAPLGQKTASGFAWILSQNIAIKIINVGGQIALAWLLGNTDYGYVSQAYAVSAFASLIQQGGLRDMLIQRGAEFDRWANPAFWLGLVQGLLATLLMFAAAPVAAGYFDPRVSGLIMVLGSQQVLHALAIVPEARLNAEMRFKLLAGLVFLFSATVTVSSVIFAYYDFGPYSLVLGWPLAALVRLVVIWRVAPVRVKWRPELSRWPAIITANGILLVASFFWTIQWYADYLILGWMYPAEKDMIGRYFWAYNLSTQTFQLIGINIAWTLMAPLARLQDEPDRQLQGFLRAARVLMIAGVPACLLQALVADPAIRLVLREEWFAAIQLIQILSLGWICLIMVMPSTSLMKANGRFGGFLLVTVVLATLFVIFVTLGAAYFRDDPGRGAAIAIAVYGLVAGPFSIYSAIRVIGGSWKDLPGIFIPPIIAGTFSLGIVWAAVEMLQPSPIQRMIQLVLAPMLGGGLYVLIISRLAPQSWRDLIEQLSALFHRRVR